MQSKQTAVEWLVQELTLPEYGDNPNWVKVAIQKAQQMEKEQIIDSFNAGYINSLKRKYTTTEQYYKENFKSE